MNIEYRNAQPADAEVIAALTAQLGYPLPVEETKNSLELLLNNPKDGVFVACDASLVVAWIHVSVTVCLESTPFAEIRGLVVDNRYHRLGIGRRLVQMVRDWSREKKLDRLRVRSQIKRSEAHLFYAGLGFTETKQQKVFDLKLVWN